MDDTLTPQPYTFPQSHPAPHRNLRKALSPRRASRGTPVTLGVPSLSQNADIADTRLTIATDHTYGASFDARSSFDGKARGLFGEKDDTLSPNTAVGSEGDHEQVFSIGKS
jgi:hypothetical protein